MIRDFIYYDEVRIASYGSQLLEGIVEKITVTREDDKINDTVTTIDAGANVKVSTKGLTSPFLSSMISNVLGGSGGLGMDLKKEFTKNSSEKSSVIENKIAEHHRFTLFRESLIENNLLIDLDVIKPHQWKDRKALRKLKPGDFIELTCRAKIFDVSHLEGMALSIETLMDLLQQFQMSKEVENDPSKLEKIVEEADSNAMELGYKIYQKLLGSSIAPLEFVAMIDLMKNMSNGALAFVPTQFSARPVSAPQNGLRFIAPINDNFLIDTKEELIFKYGYEPNQNWKMIAQICELPKKEKRKAKAPKLDLDSDVKLDDITETMTNMFMELNASMGMNAVVKYPNISVNLISVYR